MSLPFLGAHPLEIIIPYFLESCLNDRWLITVENRRISLNICLNASYSKTFQKLYYYCNEDLFFLSENSCSNFVLNFRNFTFYPLENLDFINSSSLVCKWQYCFSCPSRPETQGCSMFQVVQKWGVSLMWLEEDKISVRSWLYLVCYLVTWGQISVS